MLKYKMKLMKRSWIYVLIGSIMIPACGGGQAARTPSEITPVMQIGKFLENWEIIPVSANGATSGEIKNTFKLLYSL